MLKKNKKKKKGVTYGPVHKYLWFLVAVPQICDRVKSVALWSAKKKKLIKRPWRATVPQLRQYMLLHYN
jgi:hypothetical protein